MTRMDDHDFWRIVFLQPLDDRFGDHARGEILAFGVDEPFGARDMLEIELRDLIDLVPVAIGGAGSGDADFHIFELRSQGIWPGIARSILDVRQLIAPGAYPAVTAEIGQSLGNIALHHHADIVPWQLLAEEKGIEIRVVPIDTERDILDMDIFSASLPGSSLVCVVHTSNVLGVANPVADIIAQSHDAGAKVLIDAAQAAPHHRIDFTGMGADFVAISGHKMCGPTGIGCLLATTESIEEMEPFMSGGDMIETVTMEKSTFAKGPQKFEAGTPKIAEAIGFATAADYLSNFNMDELHGHIRGLAMYTASEIKSVPGITVYGDHSVSEGSGVVSFLHDSVHAEDLARFMDAGGFAMRTGHHCAQPLLNAYGVTSTNRVSFYLYNTMEEAEAFVEHLRYIIGKFG